ncbi:hypothetical protein TanjilG_05389 [Lupinus angustifolius]|uniref:AT-hook motif nuclear-localized protein n=1 Tax=Lupinus angustifolius TaxID=3871 RepID=A0A1J7HPN9_LUPAN|nr:PREDICTED: AT-hook motif nuclear-localized protein 10-like [Lupinus angustifolius]OIW14768.1 hypothetical protein TanjilG_05389 [Lupinus angustifolius]
MSHQHLNIFKPLETQNPVGNSESVKRKRGRPKKNGSNGSITTSSLGHSGSVDTPFTTVADSPSTVKKRGRPRGSINKQRDIKEPEDKSTHHVITVKAGECISTKIMALSFEVNSNLCILTANGTISRATLRHPSSGSVTYEGQYDIITLGGSLLLLSDKSGSSHRSGGLNVSLFGPNGLVQGGVTGGLIAASTTQVVLLSFPGNYCSESELVNQPTSSSAPLG